MRLSALVATFVLSLSACATSDGNQALNPDAEYAARVRKAESMGLAVEFGRSEDLKLLVDLVREHGNMTIQFGPEKVTGANVDDFARRLDRKIEILAGVMMQRGFANVAGDYDLQRDAKNECRLPPDPVGPFTITQDAYRVEFKDAAGKLNGSGVIVESSLAVKLGGRAGVSPFFLIAAVRDDQLEMDFLDTSLGASLPRCRIGVLIKAERPTVKVEPPSWNVGDQWTFQWEGPRGKGTFMWEVVREETVDGVEYYVLISWRVERDGVLSSAPTEIYVRKADLAFSMDKVAGFVQERSVPPTLWYSWPLAASTSWDQRFTTERPREGKSWETAMSCKVEDEEKISVPAGTFETLRVVCRSQQTGWIISERWYSPEVRSWVRERVRLSEGIRERELTSFKVT